MSNRPGCEDCGERLDHGVCPNCDEELWIDTWQEPSDNPSEEWSKKVAEQEQRVIVRSEQS